MSNLNITQQEYDVNKALTTAATNIYELEEMTSLLNRKQLKPGLITAILAPPKEYEMMDVFRFEEVTNSVALPAGKSYSEFGPSLKKDPAKQFTYSIPSFGLKFNVAPKDYANRRKFGTTNQLMTEADVLAAMAEKADASWMLHMELSLAQLINTDTNLVSGGPFTSYNFYSDIVGSSRGAATDVTLGSSIDHFALFSKLRKLQGQELARAGDSASKQVVLCGGDFFDKRYEVEKQVGLNRDLRSSFDFASQALPETAYDGQFRYDNFQSHDGLTYINYGSEIIAGTPLVGDNSAIMLPLGSVNTAAIAYAPAQTRSYVNTQALGAYGWTSVDERQGVTVYTESNYLTALKNPRAIIRLTTSN